MSAHLEPHQVINLPAEFNIGSSDVCNYQIKDSQVTDFHAVLSTGNGQTYILDRRSRTGTLVNNRPVTEVRLNNGDWIGIGPVMFQYNQGTLAVYPRGHQFRIVALGLVRTQKVLDPNTNAPIPITLIDNVTVAVEPGQFTAIIGPSGSGKSTLLNALSARFPADEGPVLVNGQNLLKQFDALKRNIVLVPQKETIHETLSVRRILNHTARLRMPAGTSTIALEREVNRVLGVVGLPEKFHQNPFQILSGGQKKRVCLANELIGNPQVVFLDEVTSGLDEEADGKMMELFNKLADTGKTVIGITHNLANVERYCHRVIVLGVGGRFVFSGDPKQAREYFGVEKLGDVYKQLEKSPDAASTSSSVPSPGKELEPARTAEQWRQKYEVQQARIHEVRILQAEAAEASALTTDGSGESEIANVANDIRTRAAQIAHQAMALTRRYADLQLADRSNLLAMAGTSVLVAALLVIVFGSVHVVAPATGTAIPEAELADFLAKVANGSMLLFLLEFSCMWFGCTNAAKEIVKEADIYRLERNFNLDPIAYYLSKVIVLSVISLAQVMILYLPVKLACQLPGDGLFQLFTLGILTVIGVLLGLVISSAAKTVDAAATFVPIIMIPQFILAGAIISLSGLPKLLAFGAALYWGHRGVISSQPQFLLDRLNDQPGWTTAHFMLGLHAVACIAAALLLLLAKDRGQTSGDLIRLVRSAVQDPNGPAARTLRKIKDKLSNTAKIEKQDF